MKNRERERLPHHCLTFSHCIVLINEVYTQLDKQKCWVHLYFMLKNKDPRENNTLKNFPAPWWHTNFFSERWKLISIQNNEETQKHVMHSLWIYPLVFFLCINPLICTRFFFPLCTHLQFLLLERNPLVSSLSLPSFSLILQTFFSKCPAAFFPQFYFIVFWFVKILSSFSVSLCIR